MQGDQLTQPMKVEYQGNESNKLGIEPPCKANTHPPVTTVRRLHQARIQGISRSHIGLNSLDVLDHARIDGVLPASTTSTELVARAAGISVTVVPIAAWAFADFLGFGKLLLHRLVCIHVNVPHTLRQPNGWITHFELAGR